MKSKYLLFSLSLGLIFLLNFLLFSSLETKGIAFVSVLIFHLVASVVVYISVEVLLKLLPNQAGMLYLALVFVKTGIFALVFKSSIFEKEQLEMVEKLVLIIPMFSFLLVEVVFLALAMKAADKKLNGTT